MATDEIDGALSQAGELYNRGLNLLNQGLHILHNMHYKYPNNTNILLALAANLGSTGQLRDADNIYKRILNLEPRNAIALVGYAEILYQFGRPKEALQKARMAKSINPSMEETDVWLSRFNLGMGDLDEAEKIANEVLNRNPGNVNARSLIDRIKHLRDERNEQPDS